MLKCLLKARKEIVIARNIKAGWKAGGLWPVSIAKPLMSRLLIENSNNTAKPDNQQHLPGTPAPRQTYRPTLVANPVKLRTPWKKIERRDYVDALATGLSHPSTRRLLWRKVEKVIDEKDYQLALLGQENEALKVRLEGSTTVRRKKVVPDPNRKFVNIEQIHRAQVAVGRAEDPIDEESGSDSPEEAEDCIVVG